MRKLHSIVKLLVPKNVLLALLLAPLFASCANLSVVQQQRKECIVFIHEKGIDEMRNICEYILKGDK